MKLSPLKIYKNLFFIFLIFLIFLIGYAFYIPYYGKTISSHTLDLFYKKSPDAITVFTGDKGRIKEAFNLAKKMPGAKLLITGVHNQNSLKTIADHQIKSLSHKELIDNYSHLIELDYEAKDTIGNVLSTLIFARQSKEMKKIIIVSSDYHLYRINLILKYLKDSKADYTHFYFYAVPTDPYKLSNMKRYLKEVFRLVKAALVLMIWN